MRHGGYKGLLGLLALAVLATGCTSGSGGADGSDGDASDKAVIEVDKPTALVDEPVRIRVTGLRAGEKITVTSEADDANSATWSGKAAFTADARGSVDLTRARPSSGTYKGADGMGLFWSMVRADGADPDENSFAANSGQSSSYTMKLAVEAGGRTIADRELTRIWRAEKVTVRELTVARDKVAGRLLLPAKGGPERAPVLLFGGSEGGGSSSRSTAALLASRGHPTLLLCYFRCPGTPQSLQDVPLEYFATAAELLAAQPGADARRMTAMGTSRGSEPAQLLAQHYPDLIRDAVVFAPSDHVVGSFPPGGKAWTKGGKAIPEGPIPYDRMRGSVLAIAGGKDTLWAARSFSESIAARKGTPEPHRALIHPDAGHTVGSYPYLPTGTVTVLLGERLPLGGTRAADAKARAESWPEVLAFLNR
ncbi:acyl-CoA thioester hydrolase/BAAT C-terminal domain-containing protein [Streptomyces amakusaensis]|uniref:Acyl-CoA thioesterase/bile acid-CoA:amino acid N-acyltransferase family protein n=1 Tax=Streptomyces amakusaensis TaxID=67271 RepID=A0ABW0AF49_9ACTN